ncbi:hypothetical protein [Candidatus Tisiphia endosymbiont of Nemotelus uliginosus]|uniref:hypothetical protein n=1 Tax=Candidatus Tisiphia endosymbiont of Nemotelus uliginosus TaxID=3077926 RepID=UPI0035C940D9
MFSRLMNFTWNDVPILSDENNYEQGRQEDNSFQAGIVVAGVAGGLVTLWICCQHGSWIITQGVKLYNKVWNWCNAQEDSSGGYPLTPDSSCPPLPSSGDTLASGLLVQQSYTDLPPPYGSWVSLDSTFKGEEPPSYPSCTQQSCQLLQMVSLVPEDPNTGGESPLLGNAELAV